jgi:GDSL-like Lipase/Acylhydrolase family
MCLSLLWGCEKMSIRNFHSNNKKRIDYTGAIIVCDGNSLTYGFQASNPATKSYPALLDADAYFSGATMYNKGVSAQETQDMIDDAVTDIDSLYSGSVPSVLVAWEVGNDIYYNGSVGDAIDRFWAYCDARRTAGWKVVVVNCPPRDQSTTFGDNSAQYNVKLAAANLRIKEEWISHADGYVDIAGDSRFQGYSLTYYDADKVHYNDTGYEVVKDLIKSALLQL